jgi:CIC family chloride channel protein
LAAIVGVLAGLVAIGFEKAVEIAETARQRLAEDLGHSPLSVLGVVAIAAILGALAGYVTERYCPEAAGSGIPHVKEVLVGARLLRPIRLIGIKLVGGFLAIAAGMSLGREGPTIHMGAATGELFGRWARVPKRSRKALLAAGAGAGLAAAFNAPLAGFLFVMEELKREMSPVTYGTALIASVASVAVTRIALGQQSSFHLADPPPVPLRDLPIVALVGAFCAVCGVLFNKGLVLGLKVRSHFHVPRWLAGLMVGALTGIAVEFYPQVTGPGHSVAAGILAGTVHNQTLISVAAALLVGKMLCTIISYGTGAPGGIFAPLLVMGSVAGLLIGDISHLVAPAYTPDPRVLATVGMASIMAASVRAPLTAVVLIVEMTGQYHLLYALLLAAFLADVLADWVHDKPIYEVLVDRDLKRTHHKSEAEEDLLEVLVEPNARMEGVKLRALQMPQGCLVAIVSREGRNFAPSGATELRAGDVLTIVVSPGVDRRLVVDLVEEARA